MKTSTRNQGGVFYTAPVVVKRITEALSGAQRPDDQASIPGDLVILNPPFGMRGNSESSR